MSSTPYPTTSHPSTSDLQDPAYLHGKSFQPPDHPPSSLPPPPSLQERAFEPFPPCSGRSPCLPNPRSPCSPQAPLPPPLLCPAPLAPPLPQRPARPHRSGPLGADGPTVEQVGAPREAERGFSRAGVRGHSRAPFWPVLGPRPGRRHRHRSRGRRGNGAATAAAAAATEPGRGEEGSAPRQDPPLRPPPATSTPSLALSLAPRALLLNGSESAKGGKRGKIPPPVSDAAAAGVAQRIAEPPPPRGTVPGSASRWRCGRGGGAEQRRVCARCGPDSPRGEPDKTAGDVRV